LVWNMLALLLFTPEPTFAQQSPGRPYSFFFRRGEDESYKPSRLSLALQLIALPKFRTLLLANDWLHLVVIHLLNHLKRLVVEFPWRFENSPCFLLHLCASDHG